MKPKRPLALFKSRQDNIANSMRRDGISKLAGAQLLSEAVFSAPVIGGTAMPI
jgi:hypothetical protein